MTLDVLFTINNLCQIYQVNRSTIYRWVRDGKLPKPCFIGSRTPRWTQEQISKTVAK